MWMLLACQSESELKGTEPDTSGSVPYVVPEDTASIQPERSLEEIEAGVTGAIEAARSVDIGVFFVHYTALMAERSASCPYVNEEYASLYGYLYWYDVCSTEASTNYNGYGYGYDYAGMVSGPYHYSMYAYLQGELSITSSTGATLSASGYASGSEYTYGDNHIRSSYAYGDFRSDSPELTSTWLSQSLSISIQTSIAQYGANDPGEVNINGGVSRLPGMFSAIWFEGVFASARTDCPHEPGGSIQIRDGNDWYDVRFQGPAAGGSSIFGPSCDGCGEVWFRGEAIGEVCPDMSTLLTVEKWL